MTFEDLMETAAVKKFTGGRKTELTFADACEFWAIDEQMRATTIDEQLSLFDDFAYSELRAVHEYLRERFSRHLNLLKCRNRTGTSE